MPMSKAEQGALIGRNNHLRFLARVANYQRIHGPYISAEQAARQMGLSVRTIHRIRRYLRQQDSA